MNKNNSKKELINDNNELLLLVGLVAVVLIILSFIFIPLKSQFGELGKKQDIKESLAAEEVQRRNDLYQDKIQKTEASLQKSINKKGTNFEITYFEPAKMYRIIVTASTTDQYNEALKGAEDAFKAAGVEDVCKLRISVPTPKDLFDERHNLSAKLPSC